MNPKLKKALDLVKGKENEEVSKQTELKSLLEKAEELKRDISKGEPGYTPVRGKDYWTDSDKEVILQDVFGYVSEKVSEAKSNIVSEVKPIKGVDYFDGINGYSPVKGKDYFDGEKGDKPAHRWKDGYLQFENPDGSWGMSVNLKAESIKGDPGVAPEHEIDGYKIRFKNPDGTWGAWIDFGMLIQIMMPRGSGGPATPTTGGGGSGTVGPGTQNEIAYFDSANTVASLSTATYPSLTELSYVKGVTSAIQTQLGNKQPLDADLTSWAAITRAAGFDTFVATPSSANLASLVTDETGSGALVFATSPGFTTAANPVSNDGASLGISGTAWSDLFLASGAVINFAAGDVTITHSSDLLTFSGAASGYVFNTIAGSGNRETILKATVSDAAGDAMFIVNGTTGNTRFAPTFAGIHDTGTDRISMEFKGLVRAANDTGSTAVVRFNVHQVSTATDPINNISGAITTRPVFVFANSDTVIMQMNADRTTDFNGASFRPLTNDVAALGTSSLMWSDLFLASGAVINFNAGNMTITHAAGTLAVAGGSFGIGTTPSAFLHVLGTTEQLRLGYDASNYMTSTIGSAANATFDLTASSGTPVFTWNKRMVAAGDLSTGATATSSNFWTLASGSMGSTGVAQFQVLGSAAMTLRTAIRGSTASIPTAGNSAAAFVIGQNPITIAGSGTHALFASQIIRPLVITGGAGTLTNSAALYIEDAATGATNNYALWVDSGVVRIDGTIELGDASDTTISRVSAGVIAVEGVTILTTANISDTAYASSWDGVTTIAPSKNAVYDKIQLLRPIVQLNVLANEPPSSAFATVDTRNGHPTLDFDGATDEEAVWTFNLPNGYAGGGITVDTYWAFTSATSGSLQVQAAIERIDLSSLDIDADSFAAFQAAGGTAPGTSGQVIKVSIAFTDGAQMDSLAAGELGRLKIRRDADGTSGTDDITTDAELLRVVIRET